MNYLSVNCVGTTTALEDAHYITHSGNSGGWVVYGAVEWEPKGELGIKTEPKESNMRGLYLVYIIDPVTDRVVLADEKPIIAKSEENAKLKAVSLAQLSEDVDEYDIIVHKLGNVSPKKEVQEVKVIKDG